MTLFDLIAIVTVLVSVLGGMNAGGVRELVGLTAFALGLGGAILLLPLSRPFAQALVQPGWAASGAALAVTFLAIYFGLQIAGRVVTARLRASGGALGALDRAAGGGVGLVRAGVLLGLVYLLYQAVAPSGVRPAWIEHAAMLPVARVAGGVLQGVAPKGVAQAGALAPLLRDALTGPGPRAGPRLDDITDDAADPSAQAEVKRTSIPRDRAPPRKRHGAGLDVTLETSR